MSQNDSSENEARAIMALQKFMPVDEMFWGANPEHGNYMVFSCPLTDVNGITLPGLRIEIAFRTPPQYDDCKYTFTIFAFSSGGSPKRAYQLEVVPLEDRSHNDDENPCYGPHHHIGTYVEEVRIGTLGCQHHEKWFREFLRIAQIGFGGRYSGPFDGGLFP